MANGGERTKENIKYSGGETTHSSERFLSKDELRKILGSGGTVSLMVTYRKKRLRLNHSKDRHSVVKPGYPVFRQKGREINL
jgi:hypothetical protein